MIQKKDTRAIYRYYVSVQATVNVARLVVAQSEKKCTSTTSCIAPDNFDKFMKKKSSYIHEKLMKKMPKEYHSEIDVFLKQNANILSNYRNENYKIDLLEGKKALFV